MYLAIDMGGTKTLLASFTKAGKLLESIRFETPYFYPDFIHEVGQQFQKLEHKDKLTSCVMGAPGRIDYEHGVVVAFGNLPWEHVSMKHDIEQAVQLPVTLENDANLAGLSEAILISHQYKKALYITVSTGIGGILIVNNKIEPEYAGMEFGHMMFEHEGRLQNWEDFASGRAIFEKYGKKASDIDDPGTWYAISHNIALGLTNVVANLTPDVIIFGGGVGAHLEKFEDQLHEAMMLYSTDLVTVPTIRKAIRAEEAVLYGCYERARQLEA